MSRYWIVGASWGGTEHVDKEFIEKGIWMLGWEKNQQEEQYKKALKIEAGDRIAIKRMKGKGATDIRILHIGIVKGVIEDVNKVICTVDWIVTNLERDLESHGCFKSIHGPYKKNEWIEKAFCL